jgi:hypothetical protein
LSDVNENGWTFFFFGKQGIIEVSDSSVETRFGLRTGEQCMLWVIPNRNPVLLLSFKYISAPVPFLKQLLAACLEIALWGLVPIRRLPELRI